MESGLLMEVWGRAQIVLGALILAVIGRDRFYLLSQDEGFLPRICRTFARHPYVVKQIVGWKEIDKDIDCERQSAASLNLYQGDSLAGWADYDRNQGDGNMGLDHQMRAIPLPPINAVLRSTSGKKVVEIGTGNGDIVAYLAKMYPSHHFVGVDLNVATARKKHSAPNLSFVEGYALDLLESGQLNGEVLLSASTFVVFPPKELKAYFKAIRDAGYSFLSIADPMVYRFKARPEEEGYSRHLAQGMWGHNYAGYLREYGFEPTFKALPYSHHKKRPSIDFQLVTASR